MTRYNGGGGEALEVWTMRAQLVPVEGGSPVEIVKDMTLLGRGEECDVRLDHKSVSKLHCVLVKTDGLLLLRDLGSTNGTRVNGTRVRRAVLLPNDRVSVANHHFRALFGAALEEVGPDCTQAIDPRDLAEVIERGPVSGPESDSEVDLPAQDVQANSLPDIYPAPRPKKEK